MSILLISTKNKDIVVAIEDKNIQDLGTSADSVFHSTPSVGKHKKLSKVLLISENSSDIYMIKKLLPKNDGYIIHEASSLTAALKVMNYLNLDLILVDDMLSSIDGYEIVTKLNYIEITKDIPKIILLTTGYKTDKKESFHCENLDFVKKPLDSVIFKLRVKSLIKHSQQKVDRKSYFKQIATQKFEEAQAMMHIYQELFETSENIMCIYDPQSAKIVESNAIFEKFFLNLRSFNRIMSNPRLVRKFVPYRDEANYLNYYDPKEWMQTLIEGGSFTYLVKLQRDFKEYSFNIFVKKVMVAHTEVYVIRLSNIYDYLPQKNTLKSETKLQLKEKNLEVFKDDFLKLRELLWHQNIDNSEVERLLYQLSTKLSIVCDDSSIVQDGKSREINTFFIVAQLLKDKFLNRNIYINDKKVDKMLEENSELLYASLNADALYDVVFGLLNNYYGSYFTSTMNHKRLEIALSQKEDEMMIKIKFDSSEELMADASLVDKIFTKNNKSDMEKTLDTLPKSVKQSLQLLNGQIKKIDENNLSTFVISIPL